MIRHGLKEKLFVTNIDSQDNLGRTALILAAYNNYPKVVQVLLNRGADVLIDDMSGRDATLITPHTE